MLRLAISVVGSTSLGAESSRMWNFNFHFSAQGNAQSLRLDPMPSNRGES